MTRRTTTGEGAGGGVFRCTAPAKINLLLRVVGRRADGYHLLRTVMTFVPALADRLEILPDPPEGGDRLEVRCDPPVTGRMEDNLAWRAADALRRAAGSEGVGRGAVIR
ncbi:MAG: hypothetical protein HQL51_06050, partial [Magnetococcales bacterium]|nr:hypothetical protein [Magnetococcales bacterium]